MTNIRDICDFRPMLYTLFEKEINESLVNKNINNNNNNRYTHWGWFDMDMIIGNITSYAMFNYNDEDIISYEDKVLANGPFSIMKNSIYMTNLWRSVENLNVYLPEHRTFGLEEVFFSNLLVKLHSIGQLTIN